MSSTPAHIARARGLPTTTLLTPKELIKTRQLYHERKFKQCIAECEKLDHVDLHSVHRTFLLFHQAICYEGLGLSAHNYSRNRIPFLQSAKNRFDAALESLPLPFSMTEFGLCEDLKDYPLSAVSNLETEGLSLSASTPTVPTPVLNVGSLSYSHSGSSSCYSSNTEIEADNAPDFDKYSFHRNPAPASKGIPWTSTFNGDVVEKKERSAAEEDEDDSTCDTDEDDDSDVSSKHRNLMLASRKHQVAARLQGSLSSTRTLDSALVPSPLFNKSRKTAVIHSNFPRTVSGQIPLLTPEPLPVSTPGPLLPIPSTPQPYNTRNHSTSRRTAISTLILKFDATIPSPGTPSSYTTCTPPSTTYKTPIPSSTPVTTRFIQISNTFLPHPNNTYLTSYLTSHSLARYNQRLSDFRTSLLSSIDFITTKLDTTRDIQEKRREEKATHFTQPHTNPITGKQGIGTRLASYWLISPSPAPAKHTHTPHHRRRNCDISPVPLYGRANTSTNDMVSSNGDPTISRIVRTSFIAQNSNANANANTYPQTTRKHSSHDSHTTLPNEEYRTSRLGHLIPPEPPAKRQARLAELRAKGWRVRKEGYGFKGCEYYDALRGSVERELDWC